MSDYPMLISNKLHSFRNFVMQRYDIIAHERYVCAFIFVLPPILIEKVNCF